MTFAMLTTFFGSHSFGGDAAFVDRLSRALARHGHDVHVIYCRDAFELSKAGLPPRPYEPPPGVTIHALASPFGPLSPLATHQTGRPLFKRKAIRRLLDAIRPEVVHAHNLSLIGGPGLLEMEVPGAVKLMTAHEHWLVCPQHVLWKHDGSVCERKECVKCCINGRRPPQLWRDGPLMARGLRALDALIAPSRSTIREHARRGIDVPMRLLPYFLPHDYTGLPEVASPRHERPYVAAAGRLELIKGFQDVIDVMPRLPGVDLRIAGAGAYESDLRRRAEGMANVHFEGRLDGPNVAALFRGARAVVVPSLVYETFGYVVLEAFHERTPVVVRDLGALPELVAESGGGIVFRTADELVAALGRLATDESLRDELGENGHKARHARWSESVHLDRYLRLIDECRQARAAAPRAPASGVRPWPPEACRPAPGPLRVDRASPPGLAARLTVSDLQLPIRPPSCPARRRLSILYIEGSHSRSPTPFQSDGRRALRGACLDGNLRRTGSTPRPEGRNTAATYYPFTERSQMARQEAWNAKRSSRVHPDRAPGRHRDHRGPDRPLVTGGAGGARGGAAGAVRQQPQAARPGRAQLPLYEQLRPADPLERQLDRRCLAARLDGVDPPADRGDERWPTRSTSPSPAGWGPRAPNPDGPSMRR